MRPVLARGAPTPRGRLTLATLALAATLLAAAACAPRQAGPRPAIQGEPAASAAKGTVIVDTVRSAALGARKQFTVYLPPSYRTAPTRRYPVAYYLHGAWGSEWDWVRSGRIDAAMDSLVASGAPEMIVVMPDGDDAWYTTGSVIGRYQSCLANPREGEPAISYCVPWPRYDDYIARDLVAHVDSTYRTLPGAPHRGIGGLSMGGYGAITLALAYPDVFSAAASHSGTLSILVTGLDSATGAPRVAQNVEELRKWWGERLWVLLEPVFGRDPAGWRARDPATLVRRLVARGAKVPALMADVGTGDRYLAQSRQFATSLREAGVPLEYTEHPGRHDWVYWRTHVPTSLAWLGARIAGP